MMGAGAVTWSLVAVSAILGLLILVLVGAWLVGRLTIDLGWGRSRHPLGPIDITIGASRDLVFDVVAPPYLGRSPRDLRPSLEVLDRGSDLVVAAHHTRLSLLTSTTVESVRFQAPERISFRLLRGVAPSAPRNSPSRTQTPERSWPTEENWRWISGSSAGWPAGSW